MDKQLLLKRKAFIEDPDIILKVPYVLDRLLEAGVLSKEEIDSIDANTIIQDEVRELVDIVRKKGNAASSVLLDAWAEPLPDIYQQSEGDDEDTIYLIGNITQSELLAFADQMCHPSTSGAACNTGHFDSKPRRTRRLPVRLNVNNPEEFMDPHVFSELDLSAHQTSIMTLVVGVLEDMHSKDVKEFMWYYSRNLKHDSATLSNPVELSSLMLEYVHDDVRIYAERVYAKLRACNKNQLAYNFKRDVFRVCTD